MPYYNEDIYDEYNHCYLKKKDYSKERWAKIVEKVKRENLILELEHNLMTYKGRLSADEELIIHAIKSGRERRRWEGSNRARRQQIREMSELREDARKQREENQKLREMISEASNRSGLFIKFVREKLGISES